MPLFPPFARFNSWSLSQGEKTYAGSVSWHQQDCAGWDERLRWGRLCPFFFLRSPKEWSCHISQRGLAKEQAERSSQELVSCLGRRTSMQGIHRDRLGHTALCLSFLWSNADADGSACVASGFTKPICIRLHFSTEKRSSKWTRANALQADDLMPLTRWCQSDGFDLQLGSA